MRPGHCGFVGVNVVQPAVQSTAAIQLATIVWMNLNELPTVKDHTATARTEMARTDGARWIRYRVDVDIDIKLTGIGALASNCSRPLLVGDSARVIQVGRFNHDTRFFTRLRVCLE